MTSVKISSDIRISYP